MATRRKRAPVPAARRAVTARPSIPPGRKLLFSAVVLVTVLAALEVVSRLFVHIAPNTRWTFHQNLVNTLGFPALNDVLMPDEELFWTVKPDIEKLTLSGGIAAARSLSFTLSTDRRGRRALPTVENPRAHIAFVGDSCTFGVGVDDDQTFPAQVQQRLAGVQGVNLGVPGYSAFQGRRRLEQHDFAAPPRVVVASFGFNDAASWDGRGDLEHAAAWKDARGSLVARSRFLALLGGLLRRPERQEPAQGPAGRPRLTDEEFVAELRALAVWGRSRGAATVLMVWPHRAQLVRNELTSKQRALLALSASDHLPIVNLIPLFREQGGDALYVDVIHASPSGNAVVAGALESLVRERLAGPDTSQEPSR